MGLPGFEPGSQGPKPRILNQAIIQPHEKHKKCSLLSFLNIALFI